MGDLRKEGMDKFKCPCCGKLPQGTVVSMNGTAVLDFDKEGLPFYTGETVVWDEQSSAKDANGNDQFVCSDGHIYFVEGVEI